MGSDLICYQFSRSKVERGDFSHFLSLYGADKLPSGRRLREMMDMMMFTIEGYGNDTREILVIPEVRQFYSSFHDAWPYWLYFCNLDQDSLKMMLMCCMTSFSTLKIDDQANCVTKYDPKELVHFVGRDFAPMNAMCERAQMFERSIHERTKAIFDYFGWPFDAPPPP